MSPYYYIKIQPVSNIQEFHYPQQEFYYPVKPRNKNKNNSRHRHRNRHRHINTYPKPKISDWFSSWPIWGCVKIMCY